MAGEFTVSHHVRGRDPIVAGIYGTLIKVMKTFGPFKEEAKKTSIHLVRKTAFAGVATRQSSVLLTVKAAGDIRSPRIRKHEQVSAGRWHLEIRLSSPDDVDADLKKWLHAAYELSA